MKKYNIVLALCLITIAGFSQSKDAVRDAAKDPKRMENSAKADVTLIDKKTVTPEATAAEKRKKPRRERVHKECSRMKS